MIAHINIIEFYYYMGASQNTTQQSEYGSFNMSLNKTLYAPSETIKGKVQLDISKQYAARDLTVEFTGNESINYKHMETETKTEEGKTVTVKEWKGTPSISPICSIKQCVWNYLSEEQKDKIIEPGSYTVPFELPVPSYAPSTCNITQDSYEKKMNAAIGYEVRGRLESTDDSKKHLGCSVPISVYEPKKPEFFGSGRGNANINKYYLFGRGESVLTCKLKDGNIINSQVLQGSLNINNLKCGRDITKIYFRIKENLNIQGTPEYKKESTINSWEAAMRIAPRTDTTVPFSVTVPVNSNYVSVNGSKIKRTYSIEVEPDYPWCNNPKVVVPLHLSQYSS